MDCEDIKFSKNKSIEEIVISGIAGRYPESDNIYDLGQNLLAKKDMITEDDRRWKCEHSEIPHKLGKINGLQKFDATFFGINAKQAHSMDPLSRILLEKSYEAIVDAGYNPNQLRKSKVGVFIGVCVTETEKQVLYDKIRADGCGITGCTHSMFANRISYWLDVTGPSCAIDTACSSSIHALEQGYRAIKDGICDAAIVGGCNICLHPCTSLQYARLGVLNIEGKCKSFDEDGNGYCRSEAVVVVFLQKAKNARRVYARLVHIKTNCDGYTEEGITNPSQKMQTKLMEELYAECNVDPNCVDFVEAHGTGTKVGDLAEVNALETILCHKRATPLKIGSIKSNIGHCEAASGMCSISKIILSFELGVILPNIHFEKPRSDIVALQNGNISVVTEVTPWNGKLMALNNSGFGGTNSHALFEVNSKTKLRNSKPSDNLPWLIVASGRTVEAVDVILKHLEESPIDVEYIRLLHEIQSEDIPGHIYRGYTLLRPNKEEYIRHIERFSGERRPVWFIYSGMGCHWPSMGSSLMEIPVCASTILKCHEVLKPKGVDLIDIITNKDPLIFRDTLNSFIGICVIQTALTDLLFSIGIRPNGMIGYSLGESGCAYADGCFTIEETILAAYYRGVAFAECEKNLIHGTMAAVGLGYKEAKEIVPPEIKVACHNGPNNCTISGPTKLVQEFLVLMKQKGIFIKEVNAANIAYHSHYVAPVKPLISAYLKEVIKYPKLRSKKWISSSVPETEWYNENAKYASAEYFTNNLFNPVYFEEACSHIPDNAITIEIAPHGQLQSILKRLLKQSITNLSISLRDSVDNIGYLFSAFGRFFEAGGNMKLYKLYPNIDFPVSRGTPMISPLIRWEHSNDWFVAWYQQEKENESGGRTVSVSLDNSEMNYLRGHIIDGRNLYPATAYLMLAWETLSQMHGQSFSDLSVAFENVRFERATNIPKEGKINFKVTVQKGSGNFEIVEGNAVVSTGRIYIPENIEKESVNIPSPQKNTKDNQQIFLNSSEIYKELNLRGYNYEGLFKGITYANNEGTIGKIRWINNFVIFMDNMLQIKILGKDTKSLFVPVAIEKVIINIKKHQETLEKLNEEEPELLVHVYPHIDLIQSGGIEIKNLKISSINRTADTDKPVIEKYEFIPYVSQQVRNLKEIVKMCTHIAVENLAEFTLKIAELVDFTSYDNLISKILIDTFEELPSVQTEIIVYNQCGIHSSSLELDGITVSNHNLPNDQSCSMVVASHILNEKDKLLMCLNALRIDGFLWTRENDLQTSQPEDFSGLEICFQHINKNERHLILRKKMSANIEPLIIQIKNDSYSWIPQLNQHLNKIDAQKNQRLIIYAEQEECSGVLGFFNCLRKEFNGKTVRCYFIIDKSAPRFSIHHTMYRQQIKKDMAINVYKNGQWGCYCHLPIIDLNKVRTPHAFITPKVHGNLSTMQWIEGPLKPDSYQPKDNHELIHVYYASLNFRDIMMATGKLTRETIIRSRLQGDCTEGFEYSGKTSNGRRVMGIVLGKAMASLLESDVDLTWDVPDKWTLEEAATIPVVYGTVLYALLMCGHMKPGESILIHAGSGGVGQAAINVCLHYNCTIFTTVSSPEKREFIRKTFPAIPDSHIGNSRDTSFEQLVMFETKGKGVHLVLNSLAENLLHASIRCLANEGRFLEIGRTDIFKNSNIAMGHFSKEISFTGVFLDKFFYATRERKLELKNAVNKAILDGIIKPLNRTIFDSNEAEAAFRFMASGKHIGKVILRIRDEQSILNSAPRIILKDANPRYYCSADKTYLICGGLGGFGLELSDWLILRGARKLVLTSRKGVRTGYQAMKIKLWQSYGAEINICQNDMATKEDVRKLLIIASTMGPVIAIFNLALVLQDALFMNQTEETFATVLQPKAQATFHLDKVSRQLCPQLEEFVVFSSVVSGYGSAGQTNYGMANSIIERICESRKAVKLPALAVQWGAIRDVGVLADMFVDKGPIVISGTSPQSIQSCLEVLDYFLKQNNTVVSSLVVAGKQIVNKSTTTITDIVANILGIRTLETISLHSTLADLGLDSMMVTEVKQILDGDYQIFLTTQEIRKLTFNKLKEMEMNHSQNKDDSKQDSRRTKSDHEERGEDEQLHFMRILDDETNETTTEKWKSVVRMPSSAVNGFTDNGSTNTCEKIFMIPDIEGTAKLMEPLGKNLNTEVYCLQYANRNFTVIDNIEKLAENLLTDVTDHLTTNETFHIVGYSYGGLIALEMVKLLEKQNRSGRLWLIDSSPKFVKKVFYSLFLNTKTEDDGLQINVIIRFLEDLWPYARKELESDLFQLNDWDSRLDLVIEKIPSEIISGKPNLKDLINSKYMKIKFLQKYKEPSEKSLNTFTTLIRPTESILNTNSFDYGLTQYFKSPVKVHFVKGDHVTVLQNKETAVLILEELNSDYNI